MTQRVRIRTMGIIMGMIIVLTLAHLIGQYAIQNRVLTHLIGEEQHELHQMYRFMLRNLNEKYLAVGESLLSNPSVCAAVAEKDRATLYNHSKHLFQQLRTKNPDLNIMHFHTADTHSLLRLHRPQHYGDDLSTIRHLINRVNATLQPQFGLEVGKYAISYRIALPVRYKNEHVGVLEFGVDIRYFNRFFERNLHTLSHFIFSNEAIAPYLQHGGASGIGSFGDMSIIGLKHQPLYDYGRLLEELKTAPFVAMKDDLYLFEGPVIEDFQGNRLGRIYLIHSMHFLLRHTDRYRIIHVVVALMLLFIAFYSLRYAFDYYNAQIEERQKLLEEQNVKLQELAETDPLTRTYNRRKILAILNDEHERLQRYGGYLSIILFDIDDFKQINDTYGHNTGDEVLKSIAELILGSIRKSDFLARWGGEEFIIVSAENSLAEATALAEKLRARIANHLFDFNGLGSISCSFGVTQVQGDQPLKEAISSADAAMYTAKESGKNCVKRFPDDIGSTAS